MNGVIISLINVLALVITEAQNPLVGAPQTR